MEISTEDNENLVQSVCNHVRDCIENGTAPQHWQQIIYDIDYLVMEANSGASFEQYFRWASLEEIKRVVLALEEAGLSTVAKLTQKAIGVAFPDGLPASDEEKSDLTDWTEDQENKLSNLFETLEQYNGHITNRLADFARASGA